MAVRVTFDREKVMQRVQRGLAEGIAEVALTVQEEIQETVNYPGKGVKGYLGRTEKGRKRWTRNPRSLPGDPPAKQTGNLGRSWQSATRQPRMLGGLVTLRVSQDPKFSNYGGWLDKGTSRMAARPHLDRSIALADDGTPSLLGIMESRLSKSLRKHSGMFRIRGVAS